jgi:hypothetical protein
MYGLIFDVLERLFIEKYGSASWDSVINRTNSWQVVNPHNCHQDRACNVLDGYDHVTSAEDPRASVVVPTEGTTEAGQIYQIQPENRGKMNAGGIVTTCTIDGNSSSYRAEECEVAGMTYSPLVTHRPDIIKREAWSLNRKYDDDLFLYMATMGAEIAGTYVDDLIEKTGFYFLDYIRYSMSLSQFVSTILYAC